MTKSGVARIVILIFFFLFMILYSMQAAGYNEYSQNKKNMLTAEQIEQFEQDVAAGKDVSVEDYLKSIDCKYIDIDVFGTNKAGLEFYLKKGYIIRTYKIIKEI